jgi:hypothetical protein
MRSATVQMTVPDKDCFLENRRGLGCPNLCKKTLFCCHAKDRYLDALWRVLVTWALFLTTTIDVDAFDIWNAMALFQNFCLRSSLDTHRNREKMQGFFIAALYLVSSRRHMVFPNTISSLRAICDNAYTKTELQRFSFLVLESAAFVVPVRSFLHDIVEMAVELDVVQYCDDAIALTHGLAMSRQFFMHRANKLLVAHALYALVTAKRIALNDFQRIIRLRANHGATYDQLVQMAYLCQAWIETIMKEYRAIEKSGTSTLLDFEKFARKTERALPSKHALSYCFDMN